jgi:hypothetical protein
VILYFIVDEGVKVSDWDLFLRFFVLFALHLFLHITSLTIAWKIHVLVFVDHYRLSISVCSVILAMTGLILFVQRDGLLTQNVDEHDTLHNMHQVILEMCS